MINNDEKEIKTWKEFAIRTLYELENTKDALKETQDALRELRADYRCLKETDDKRYEKFVRLEARIYAVTAIIVIILGVLEFTINR